MTNTTMNVRIITTFVVSLIGLFLIGAMKSSVIVDELVSTRDESVDMDAERTRTMMIAMIAAGSVESMLGMIESKPSTSTFMS